MKTNRRKFFGLLAGAAAVVALPVQWAANKYKKIMHIEYQLSFDDETGKASIIRVGGVKWSWKREDT